MEISLSDLEQAINFWRNRYPSTGEEQKLCAQANALATPYAAMIMNHRRQLDLAEFGPDARAALESWRQSDPPVPAPPVEALRG